MSEPEEPKKLEVPVAAASAVAAAEADVGRAMLLNATAEAEAILATARRRAAALLATAEKASKETSQAAELMTQEEFAAQMTQLTERARAAGLRPIHAMIRTYLQQGATMLDKVLEGFDPPVDNTKKKA